MSKTDESIAAAVGELLKSLTVILDELCLTTARVNDLETRMNVPSIEKDAQRREAVFAEGERVKALLRNALLKDPPAG